MTDDVELLKRKYEQENTLLVRAHREWAAERAGLLREIADMRDALKNVLDEWRRMFGNHAEVHDVFRAGLCAHARASRVSADNARAEVQGLIAKADEVPQLVGQLHAAWRENEHLRARLDDVEGPQP